MDKNCVCNYFDEKESPPQKVMNNFEVVAMSIPYGDPDPKDKEFTSLLQCPKCQSYYLMHVHNSIYPNQETVSVGRYQPKVDVDILIGTIKSLEGIVTSIELDDYSELRAVANRAVKSMRGSNKNILDDKN
jgi:hypothetical protein